MVSARRGTMVRIAAVSAAALVGPRLVGADFLPGGVYVIHVKPLGVPGAFDPDRIVELDPATGQARLWAQLDRSVSGLGGLDFSPDNAQLVASDYGRSRIVGLSPSAGLDVLYDHEDGVLGPIHRAYDASGNLYIASEPRGAVLRIDAGTQNAYVFADQSDGVSGWGPLAAAPDGDVYHVVNGSVIRRFTEEGDGQFFAFPPGQTGSIEVDSHENVFLNTSSGIFVYDGGNPDQPRLLFDPGFGVPGGLALSADERDLFALMGPYIYRLDPATGALRGQWIYRI